MAACPTGLAQTSTVPVGVISHVNNECYVRSSPSCDTAPGNTNLARCVHVVSSCVRGCVPSSSCWPVPRRPAQAQQRETAQLSCQCKRHACPIADGTKRRGSACGMPLAMNIAYNTHRNWRRHDKERVMLLGESLLWLTLLHF
eukprot:6060383-Amphidinium_carterae.1